MSKYCTSSPWCEEDVCRCDAWAEESNHPTEKEPVEIGINYGVLDTNDEELPF